MKIGKSKNPIIDARDTYFLINRIHNQIRKINKAILKLNAVIKPIEVDTPFPPLNLRKGEKS
jgi:hypothetical protein